jgi:hypothetical protein
MIPGMDRLKKGRKLKNCLHNLLTNSKFSIIMRNMSVQHQSTKPRFAKGQKVIIRPVGQGGITERENSVNEYSGQTGEVVNYYWISPRLEQIFYI